MMKAHGRRALALLMAMAVSPGGGAVWASGFQLREQSAEGMGNAYAGSTAKAYDVDTAFYNPAGMTRLPGSRAGVSAAWVAPSSKFEGRGIVAGAETAGSTGGNHSMGVAVGAAYGMWELAPDWRLGLALTAPFGMRSDYREDWVGRYLALDTALVTLNASPSLAYRVDDRLSLAAGLQISWIDTLLTNAINFNALVPGAGDGLFRASGDDLALGWTASALYEFSPATRLGLSYRSTVRHAIHGSAEFQGVPGALGGDTAFTNSPTDAVITLPDTATLGLYHQLSPQWAVMSDLSWTGWSVFRTLRLGFESGRADVVLPQNWDDSWFVSLGATYQASEALSLHVGTAYDWSPVSEPYRNARLPDSNRLWLSGGFSYAVAPGHRLDFSYAHLFAGTAAIDQRDPDQIGGQLVGSYDNHVDVISLMYSVRL